MTTVSHTASTLPAPVAEALAAQYPSGLSSLRRIRLILGDQLNAEHSWFANPTEQSDTLYIIAELHQEATYAWHHIQKATAFFVAMERFASALKQAGLQVLHLTLDDTRHSNGEPLSLSELLYGLANDLNVAEVGYQRPDEKRLLAQMNALELPDGVSKQQADTEHFLLPFDDIFKRFKAGKHQRLEAFYRYMRKRFDILMDNGEPQGGRWNFDSENRQTFKADDLAGIPQPLCFAQPVDEVVERLARHNVKTIGQLEGPLIWPTSRREALQLLDFFCEHCLPYFGKFQDAMTHNAKPSWSLYHSRISFALNAKMLSVQQVINAVLNRYYGAKGAIDIAQVEGFVRQVIGWREYVRGIYWINADEYDHTNVLEAKRDLPDWFWTGKTKMACMRHAIEQSLEYSYAHHIQRLMVTGNFSLLAGIHPDQVEAWYLGIYIDALEWVEQPNTRSMVLFADGGWVATKPYAASGNYINKMSDYCKSCAYKPSKKVEKDACPFNSLYWAFLHRHQARFEPNPRMGFTYKTWNRMSEEQRQGILDKADRVLASIETL